MRDWAACWLLETQPCVLVPAFGTNAERGAGRRHVKRIASDAMKSRLATLELKAPMITTIIPKPKAQESEPNERAVNGRGVGEIHELSGLGGASHQPTASVAETLPAAAHAMSSITQN